MLALFLILYGFVRIIVENYREPDAHLGEVFIGLTMGQLLSIAMVVTGLLLWVFRTRTIKPTK